MNNTETSHFIERAAEARGVFFRKERLADWHREGLLPKPQRVFPGDGGSESFYPAGTVDLAIACARLLDQGLSYAEAGWALWMRGFPVRTDVWMRQLRQLHMELSAAMSGAVVDGEFTQELTQAAAEVAGARRLPSPLGAMRRRVGKDGLKNALELFMNAAAGTFMLRADSPDRSKDEDLIGRLLAIKVPSKKRPAPVPPILPDRASDFLERVAEMSEPVAKVFKSDFFDFCTPGEICEARDELVLLLKTLTAVRAAEEQMTGYVHPRIAPENGSMKDQAGLLLLWLGCRKIPLWRNNFDYLVRGLAAATAMADPGESGGFAKRE